MTVFDRACFALIFNVTLIFGGTIIQDSEKQKLSNECPENGDFELFGENCDKLCPTTDDTYCQNGGACVLMKETQMENLIGPTIVENITHICACEKEFMGQACDLPADTFEENMDCVHGNFSADNFITGCSCAGSHYHGWHCEISDQELCEEGHVDMEDSGVGVGQPKCICEGNMYGEFCENSCEADFHCSISSHCVYDESQEVKYCECSDGWYGLKCDEKISCTEEECSSEGGICQSIPPTNTIGCICKEGYFGPTCHDTCNSLDDDFCVNGSCEKSGNFSACQCDYGYSGSRCETRDSCELQECLNGGTCNSETGECQCSNEHEGNFCENESPCHPNTTECNLNGGECVLVGNNAVCMCNEDFTGKYCEMPSKPAPCESNPCQNGGSCLPLDGDSYTCQCAENYTGDNCEQLHKPDPCEASPCQNDGNCVPNDDGTFRCECTGDFTGSTCEVPPDPCLDEPCLNGGKCWSHGDFVCECEELFGGKKCDSDFCYFYPCFNKGAWVFQRKNQYFVQRCTPYSYSYTCKCPENYTGDNCEQLEKPDPCESNPCQNEGNCVSKNDGTFDCECVGDFTGSNCEVPPDACHDEPCLNGGTCSPNGDDFVCDCGEKFTGKECDIEVNMCVNNPCQNGGECVVGDKGYSCKCTDNYGGENCESLVDACSDNPCQNGAECEVQKGSNYICKCTEDFEGDNCEVPISNCDIDCQNGADCISDSNGGFVCKCTEGFEGDNCELPIQECNLTCQNQGNCTTDNNGGFMCECVPGFVGDLCELEPDAECSINPCRHEGVCLEGPVCVCAPGYSGKYCEHSSVGNVAGWIGLLLAAILSI